ncbi:MAG: carbohydrate-binding domain-containing protein [Bacteroidales bacterium]|nr:carbohydrate-binding domain-containing protein [Bacteroidales bacterium]
MKLKYLLPIIATVLLACNKEDILPSESDVTPSETTLTDPELSWSASSFEAQIGEDNTFPTLSNEYKVTVTYSSSDTDVATIDSDGNITLLSAGTTSIMASSAATSTYSAGSASYALTVTKAGDGISWSASACTVTYGDEDTYSFPTLSNPGSQSITYTSSNEYVATIAEDGTITIVAEGETTITATAEANDAYESASASYTLTVEGDLESAGLSWSETAYTATLASSENSFPELSNPNSLTVTYSSSDETVATIDASSGEITLVAEGTVAIIATSAADDTYAAGSASYTLKVVKQTVTLEWSASNFSVVLEEGSSSYPTLTVSPSEVASGITYASSKTSVATIASDGTITLVAAGSTTISATFAGDDTYKAGSASYTLTVTSTADDGAVTTTFDSAGDTSSDDDISNTTFTRLVTVTYSSSGASVSGYSAVADVMNVSVSGAQVTITYTGSENVVYKLTGSSSNGFFKLYSSKKQALWLSGLSLTCTSGAAINNQSGKRTFVYVDGTNTLADGSSAAYSTSSDEDMKGVLFSEGQLCFSGSGSLTVTANNKQSKSGIISDDYVRVLGSPTIKVTAGSSAGHGIRGKEYVQLSNGTLNVSTSAAMKKGIGSDGYVLVENGTHTITVTGGVAYDSDDAEYKGTAGIKADNYFGMTGGTVTITNSGAGGKGIAAGSYDYVSTNSTAISDSYMTGGTLKVTTTGSESNDVSSKAIKIGYKQKSGNSYLYGGNFKVSGGSIVASASKSETIETKGTLTVTGGEIYSTSSADDAINSYGNMTISGGYVYAYTTKGDAMDANGNLTLSGGYVFAVTTAGNPEVALDANTEGGAKLIINSGATVVAYGGLENNYSASQTVYSMSGTAGSWNALYNGSSFIAAFKTPSGLSSFAVSAPSLSKGYKGVSVGSTTYCNGIWATSGISGGTAVSLSSYSGGGQGGGGNQGGGGPGGGGRHW